MIIWDYPNCYCKLPKGIKLTNHILTTEIYNWDTPGIYDSGINRVNTSYFTMHICNIYMVSKPLMMPGMHIQERLKCEAPSHR